MLAESVDTYQVMLNAYILMPNHFHLLLQTVKANLSEFMRRFNICYTGWFNYHHGRCGHLFQGRYRSLLIDADNYLLEVSRYLHLNVVRKPAFKTTDWSEKWRVAKNYRWSTLPGYLDNKRIVPFVSYDRILDMIGGQRAYRDFILDGVRRGMRDPFNLVKYRTVLGDDDFIMKVKAKRVEGGSTREQPSYRGLIAKVVDAEAILQCVAEVMRLEKPMLSKRRGHGVARGIAAELLYRYSSLNLGEIGRFLGDVDYCTVSQLRRRLKLKVAQDKKIGVLFEKAHGKVTRLCHM